MSQLAVSDDSPMLTGPNITVFTARAWVNYSCEAVEDIVDPAQEVSRLFALRPEPRLAPFPGGSPEKRTLKMGEKIDAANFSPDAAARAANRGAPDTMCRYVGELLVK